MGAVLTVLSEHLVDKRVSEEDLVLWDGWSGSGGLLDGLGSGGFLLLGGSAGCGFLGGLLFLGSGSLLLGGGFLLRSELNEHRLVRDTSGCSELSLFSTNSFSFSFFLRSELSD